KWWEKARAVGEEAYFLEHVLPADPQEQWPEEFILCAIAAKYPKHLPKIYRTILDERPRMQSWPLAEPVAASPLPLEEKVALFLHAVGNKRLEHRRKALAQLRTLAPGRFVTLLIDNLEALPPTPEESYWKCPEGALGGMVEMTDDPRAWQTLTRV